MLEITNLHAGYGKVEVLRGLSLGVPEGAIVALVGANGAGKTTTMAAIAGQVSPTLGEVRLAGENLAGRPAHRIVRKGISLVPEGRQVVATLTVEENLRIGAHVRRDGDVEADLHGVFARFPRLLQRRSQWAGSLSGGEQQMLAIGRAMMARPRLLLLDEPSMGLAPQIVAEIFHIIEEINATGTTILLVEQNARKALSIADHAYVLDGGTITLEGPGRDLLRSPAVIEAYLGGNLAAAA